MIVFCQSTNGITPYLTFTVESQSNDLTYHQPYKVRQSIIHNLISYMHELEGYGYRTIAKKLNSWGIQTERGTMWNSPKVHSVLKRQRQRDQRISELREKTYSLQIKDIQLEYSPL